MTGDAEVQLTVLHKVGETVETGIQILKIVGAYAAVIDAIQWLILQNLKHEVSRSLLSIAIAAMK